MLPVHRLKVALMHPQIAPNTGNIGRLCVASSTELHLIRPLGFVLGDRELKRSGMDYWPRLKLMLHDDEDAYFQAIGEQRLWLFTSKSDRSLWSADFQANDMLLFGSETQGLSDRVRQRFPDRTLQIPQTPGERCLNLATAVGIGLYEALRQVSRR